MSRCSPAVCLTAVLLVVCPALALTGPGTAGATREAQAASRPNIVVIATDDQRADMMRFLPKTRRWLAEGGTTFANGYASTPSCCPARAVIMSGRYSHNNGQTSQGPSPFDLTLTVQRYLRDAGYLTGHSGKFLHWWRPDDGVPPGWDRWAHAKAGRTVPGSTMYHDVYMNVDGVIGPSSGYSTRVIFAHALRQARDFTEQDPGRPFYLHVMPFAPHYPATPEDRYVDAPVAAFDRAPSYMERRVADKPAFLASRRTTDGFARSFRKRMIRTLRSVDDQVDRLLTELQELGELDNTLVVFTSDNGYLLGEHRFRTKFLPYRASVQVPLLVRWPGHVPAGETRWDFATHADITPTLLDAAGVTQDLVPLDGHSLLGPARRSMAFMEYWQDPTNSDDIHNWASIRTRRYQYTEWYAAGGWDTVIFREYYDMRADPHQLVNLLADGNWRNDPDLRPLTSLLAAQRSCVGASCA